MTPGNPQFPSFQIAAPPPTPRTTAGRELLERESLNDRSFPLITADAILAIETEAQEAALAALREQVLEMHDYRPKLDSYDSGPCAFDGCPDTDDVHVARRSVLRLLSGAAPAPGEVARIGFPGQPFGYATGGNAPAAPAALALDVAGLAQALSTWNAIGEGDPEFMAWAAQLIRSYLGPVADPPLRDALAKLHEQRPTP